MSCPSAKSSREGDSSLFSEFGGTNLDDVGGGRLKIRGITRRKKQGSWVSVAELIREHSTMVKDEDTIYIARIYAEERTDGTWEGWLEFHSTDKSKPVLRTGEETSQPSRAAMDYWALGLEPIYLEGALARAEGRFVSATLKAIS